MYNLFVIFHLLLWLSVIYISFVVNHKPCPILLIYLPLVIKNCQLAIFVRIIMLNLFVKKTNYFINFDSR